MRGIVDLVAPLLAPQEAPQAAATEEPRPAPTEEALLDEAEAELVRGFFGDGEPTGSVALGRGLRAHWDAVDPRHDWLIVKR